MKTVYALYDKLDKSISSHFIGGEGASDAVTLRAVRAQFKDHFAVKDLSLVKLGFINEIGDLVVFQDGDCVVAKVKSVGELYLNPDINDDNE